MIEAPSLARPATSTVPGLLPKKETPKTGDSGGSQRVDWIGDTQNPRPHGRNALGNPIFAFFLNARAKGPSIWKEPMRFLPQDEGRMTLMED